MADMSHVRNWNVVLALAARPETYFFPVGTNKRPIAGHGGQKRSVRRASEVEADFLREPHALAAVDCAKSNRFTLDCDVAGDSHRGIDPTKASGVDVIEALYKHHGDDI